MKGQIFTMDLFAAYGVFLIILLIITAMAFSTANMIVNRDKYDEMGARAIAGLDYLCYGDNFTYEPYKLKTEPVQWFFGQGSDYVYNTLKPGWNYSLQIVWANETAALSAGSKNSRAGTSISFERVVYYQGQQAKAVMVVWD